MPNLNRMWRRGREGDAEPRLVSQFYTTVAATFCQLDPQRMQQNGEVVNRIGEILKDS